MVVGSSSSAPVSCRAAGATGCARSCSSAARTTSTGSSAGSSTTGSRPRSPTPARSSRIERGLHLFVEPDDPALRARTRVADRLLELDVRQLALRRHHGHARLDLPAPQRALLLRAQHVHGRHGHRARPLRAVPDRAAAAAARARLRGLGAAASPASSADSGIGAVLVNPYAAVPSMHVCFALMLGRADGADGAPPLGEGALVAVPAAASRGSSSRRPTTGGSTPPSAPPPRPSPPPSPPALFARARPDAWAWDRTPQPAGA